MPLPLLLGGIGLGLGTGMNLAGSFLGADAADERKQALKDIANTPGLDIGAITGEALTSQEGYLPRASALASKVGMANQQAINAQEESALPGVQAARAKALGRISGLFDEDAAWLKGLQRRGAALGLSSGLRGSQAGQMQTLRLSDQESMQRTQLGTGLLGSLINGMRMANTPGVQAFLGPNASDQVNIRSQERAQRMSILAQAAGAQSGGEVWGSGMRSMGSTLMGAGAMGMLGGSGLFNGYGGGSGWVPTNYSSSAGMPMMASANDFGGELMGGS